MTWYAKAVKTDSAIDATFLQNDRWAAELQKLLGQAGVIKIPVRPIGKRYAGYDLRCRNTGQTAAGRRAKGGAKRPAPGKQHCQGFCRDRKGK